MVSPIPPPPLPSPPLKQPPNQTYVGSIGSKV